MNNQADSITDYIANLPKDRKEPMIKLRQLFKTHLPKGFEETFSNGMIHFVIPHTVYPGGYHVNPDQPLPLISLASQKNYIALYHMGLYAFPDILDWFTEEYRKRVPSKLDMGKSCIRMKKMDHIPYDLIAELCQNITPEDYIEQYELARQK
ncbi:DUF1801 domain-containing protein [Alkalibacterium sp. MB6]|uniref:DUF1801 domain-containing protein n=1 Tax=Alkalibacterium sp. MB6 TaxID=2081965 RepID=UPI001379A779|nr:DUF1801 domain-containing protein [Alkalibacterium sp. MB6]